MQVTLSGRDLIEAGMRDLQHGRETIAALIVSIGAPRLWQLGIELPDHLPENPERRLYALLAKDESDSAHTRYYALIRRLVSFERAAQIERGSAIHETTRTKHEKAVSAISCVLVDRTAFTTQLAAAHRRCARRLCLSWSNAFAAASSS